MSNTDDMLYEQCKRISEELDELVDKYNNTDDCDDFIEYIEDNFGIDYIWRMGVGLIGVRILVAFGGPNIYIDTFEGVIRGYWGGTQSYPLYDSVVDTINDYFEDCAAENIYFDSHNN